jgi:pyruvate/2-oxoglutarate dehydrogenase complex dihydrolipoamide dehydrogenase (E3) component
MEARMQVEQFDVVVVGAGSGGETLAATLGAAGRTVAIVEEHLVGGECPFLACMPSKAMVRSAEVRHSLHHVQDLGAMGDALHPHVPDKGWARAVERRDEIVDHRRDDAHAEELAAAGVTLVRGRGRLTGDGVIEVASGDGCRTLAGADIVIATGSRPVIPPIEGIDAVPTWTSDEAWTATERPQSAIVLGGGPVGCEIAQVLARFDVDVSVVEQAEALTGAEEPAVSDALAEVFRAEGITVILGASAERAEAVDDGVRLHLSDGSSMTAERLVLAVGRAPTLHDVGLDAVGLDEDEGLEIDDACRVVGPARLWAVGDVTGIAPFTHMANHQARVVAEVLLGGDARVQHRAIPRAIYTDPPVAGVGLTAAAAREAGRTVEVVDMDLSMTARHKADGGAGGHLVLVADADRGVLVGASAVGAAAPEWMTQLVLAIHAEVPITTLAEVIQPFPTYAEALQPLLAELQERLADR